ncbi:hypothetical protein ANCDUO_00144 [Ancylostoma duodenale]|uniref:Uncharacterized protein n=1 Tax=Ancylostoma duodenale TaxID=51022 RepID=A0A0C2H6L1_9BILA|nr:hypothetical protein ANCDUO_00144 [Ancylostoma duodenale]
MNEGEDRTANVTIRITLITLSPSELRTYRASTSNPSICPFGVPESSNGFCPFEGHEEHYIFH